MARGPRLRIAAMDAAVRIAKVAAAERANVPYTLVSDAKRPLCAVTVDDYWVTRETGPWVIAYRLVLQDGRLVIGELRVYPRVDDAPPWDIARDLQGIRAPAPAGGLTAAIVHAITVGGDVNLGRLIVRELRGKGPLGPMIWNRLRALGVQTEEGPPVDTAHRKGGPKGKGIAFYRRIARTYLAAPSRPVQAVARAEGLTTAQARDAIHRARHRHRLLPPTSRGKAGGSDLAALQRIAAGHTPPTASRTTSRTWP